MARPEGVRVVRPDGTEIPCDLVYDGYDAARDMNKWRIVNVGVRVCIDLVRCAKLPARTELSWDLVWIDTP